MRKLIVFGIFLLAITWSCEDKFTIGEYSQYDIEANDSLTLPGETFIGKKGIVLAQNSSDWSSKVSSTGSYWHYSGTSKISIKEPGNLDFVPMLKDTADLNDETIIEALYKMKENGQLRYILGFNEPDNPEMANMTVAEALALWPTLEQFDVPLGSPLCVEADGSWMDDFMSQAGTAGLRIDYVSVQWSGAYDVNAFLNKMESIYNKYRKPIWITSFTLENARLSEVMTFMEQVLPELESRDYVFRYAWLSGGPNTSTALWDDQGGLTNRGQYYANFITNDFISMGRDDWIDFESLENIAVNPGFETGDWTGWTGFGNEVVSDSANSGEYAGKASTTGWGSSIAKDMEVIPGATYYLSYAIKILAEIPAPEGYEGQRMLIRDPEDGELEYYLAPPVNSADWITFNDQVIIPDTVTSVRLSWYRPKDSPTFMLDDLFFAVIE